MLHYILPMNHQSQSNQDFFQSFQSKEKKNQQNIMLLMCFQARPNPAGTTFNLYEEGERTC